MDKGTVGHLGFTGTSFFIEPEREAVYIILSNRVHLSYDENLAQMKNFRLKTHSNCFVKWREPHALKN